MLQSLPGLTAISWALLLPAIATAGQVSDDPVFAADAKYVGPEFSLDYRHMTWDEPSDAGEGDLYHLWYDRLDDESLLPESPDGRGVLLGQRKVLGMEKWGETGYRGYACDGWEGHYSVFLDQDGYLSLVLARNSEAPCVVRIGPDLDETAQTDRMVRAFPYPMQNAESQHMWVAYHQTYRAAALHLVFLTDLASPTFAPVLIDSQSLDGGKAPALLNLPWWYRGGTRVFFGIVPDCGFHCPIEIAAVDTADPNLTVRQVTFDRRNKISVFPYRHGGEVYLATGLDFTDQGLIYREVDSDVFELVDRLRFQPRKSTLQASDDSFDPFLHQSLEAFEWGGDTYGAYVVSEENADGLGKATSNQTEVWVAKLSDSSVRCRVSADDAPGEPMARIEPEPVSANGRAFVYYSAGRPTTIDADYEHALRRIDLGAKETFDLRCRLGRLW